MIELLKRKANGDALRRAIWTRKEERPWLAVLSDIAAVVESELEWLEGADRRWVQSTAVEAVQELLTRKWPESGIRTIEVDRKLGAFCEWIVKRPDYEFLRFCWKLLDQRHLRFLFDRLHDLGRLQGDLQRHHLRLARSLATDVENMVCWPSERWEWAAWKRDSLPYYKAIAHESYIVRLWAAKAIGCLHSHVGTDPTTELLDWFRNLEAASPGAAGAFLEGAGWPYDAPIRDVERGYMRRWFLDCLRAGVAPQIPSVQPLEFYAHEYFCRDQEAIREMLRMGRIELAIETATEDSTAQGVLWDVLQEMAASTDPEVSLPIRSYLSR